MTSKISPRGHFKLNEKYFLLEAFSFDTSKTKELESLQTLLSDTGGYSKKALDTIIAKLATTVSAKKYELFLAAKKDLDTALATEVSGTKLVAPLKKYMDELEKIFPAISLASPSTKTLRTTIDELNKIITIVTTKIPTKKRHKQTVASGSYMLDTAIQDIKAKSIEPLIKKLEQSTSLNKLLFQKKGLISPAEISTAKTQLNELVKTLLPTARASLATNIQAITTMEKTLQNAEAAKIDFQAYVAKITTQIDAIITIGKQIPAPQIMDPKEAIIAPDGTHTNFDNIAKAYNSIKELNTELSTLILTINKIDQTLSSLLGKQSAGTNLATDWMGQLKQAAQSHDSEEALEKVWDSYFNTEWGENKEAVKALGYYFQQELLRLGFNSVTNPFITYVKNLMTNKIFPDVSQYSAIHNAYIYKYITNADLRGTSEKHGNLSVNRSYSLIINKSLFTKDANTILKYLSLQAEILDKYNYNKPPFSNEALNDTYAEDPVQFLAALFFEHKNPVKLDKSTSLTTDFINGELKSLTVITDLIIACFGEDAIKAAWDSNASNTITSQLKTQEDSINAIKYLYITNALDPKDLTSYEEIDKIGTNFNLKTLPKFTQLFNKYTIDKSNAKQVIADIAKAAGLTKKE